MYSSDVKSSSKLDTSDTNNYQIVAAGCQVLSNILCSHLFMCTGVNHLTHLNFGVGFVPAFLVRFFSLTINIISG